MDIRSTRKTMIESNSECCSIMTDRHTAMPRKKRDPNSQNLGHDAIYAALLVFGMLAMFVMFA